MVVNMKVVRKRHRKLKPLKSGEGHRVKFGVLNTSGGDNVQKAVFNEFGTRGGASGGGWGGPIPERPFMRSTMRENRGKYRGAMRQQAKRILLGDTAIGTVLSQLGAMAQGDAQSMIVSLSSPPNSPVTVSRKGSSNPLIDSGAMRQSVSWEVF